MSQNHIVEHFSDNFPDSIEFRGYQYNLWMYFDHVDLAYIEAYGIRDGYAQRMYGHTKARVKRFEIQGQNWYGVFVR